MELVSSWSVDRAGDGLCGEGHGDVVAVGQEIADDLLEVALDAGMIRLRTDDFDQHSPDAAAALVGGLPDDADFFGIIDVREEAHQHLPVLDVEATGFPRGDVFRGVAPGGDADDQGMGLGHFCP